MSWRRFALRRSKSCAGPWTPCVPSSKGPLGTPLGPGDAAEGRSHGIASADEGQFWEWGPSSPRRLPWMGTAPVPSTAAGQQPHLSSTARCPEGRDLHSRRSSLLRELRCGAVPAPALCDGVGVKGPQHSSDGGGMRHPSQQ